MFLKPSNSATNTRGLVFRRYTNLMDCSTDGTLFKTTYVTTKFWKFDPLQMEFILVDDTTGFSFVKNVAENSNFFYEGWSFTWANGSWTKQSGHKLLEQNIQIDEIKRIIAEKYQKNEYYYVGSFKYLTKGSISSTVVQPISGLELDLESRNIRIDTDIEIREQDIVVVMGLHKYRCYMVENAIVTQKRMPKAFNITQVTLNGLK